MAERKTNKPILEKITDTLKSAAHVVAEGAKAIADPTAGTPMQMPLNESRYELTHPHLAPKEKKRPARKRAKKSGAKAAKPASPAGRKAAAPKNNAKKTAKKRKRRSITR